MVIRLLTREDWIMSLTDYKEDRFAKTFLAKADMYNIWNTSYGLFDQDELLGGICFTYSKREPKTVNLQLLHTFYKHRKKGVGKLLTEFCIENSYNDKVKYFRVSSEKTSVTFYENIGLKFWGKQKSGTSLCFGELTSPFINGITYNKKDSYVYKKVFEHKGCVVSE